MRHWMAVGAAALLATGISLADMKPESQRALTPGLPLGWKSDGLVAGVDQVGVDRPDGASQPELVVKKLRDAGKPLLIYQTIDALPWRGRVIVYKVMKYTHLEPEVMKRIANAPVSELRIECDGAQPSVTAYVSDTYLTRHWLESNLRLKVPNDATHCRFGLTVFVQGEYRLSRLRLRDDNDERAAYLARRHWPTPETRANVAMKFPADAAGAAAPNLEFTQ